MFQVPKANERTAMPCRPELFETLKVNGHKMTENQRELVFTAATNKNSHRERQLWTQVCIYLFVRRFFGAIDEVETEERESDGEGGTEMADADCE